jgi:predicted nucleic acid-binding protein
VTRYLLDTNILSNPTKPQPSEPLLAWWADQEDDDLWTSTWSLAEMRRGILQMPPGRKRREVEAWFDGPAGPQHMFDGQVLPFDEAAAEAWAVLMSDGYLAGRPKSALDMIIAAIALANDCTLVTDNERHFQGVVPFINPMR